MNDKEFWMSLYRLIAVLTVLGLVLMVGSCQTTKYQIRKMVDAGADPIVAACAFDIGVSTNGSALCHAQMQRRD